MHKVVYFLRYRDDVDRPEAERRFAQEHAALILAVAGVVRYVQNPVVTSATLAGVASERPVADVFSTIWFADREAYLAALESPEWELAAQDAGEIFDLDVLSEGWAAEIEERVRRQGLGRPRTASARRRPDRSSWSASCATAGIWIVTSATPTGPGGTAR